MPNDPLEPVDPRAISTGGQIADSGVPDPLSVATGGIVSSGVLPPGVVVPGITETIGGDVLDDLIDGLDAIDVALRWDPAQFFGDILLGTRGDLLKGHALPAAVLMSLLTWRRAQDGDDVADFAGEKFGWWGDSYAAVPNDLFGSRIWTLFRSKLTARTPIEVEALARESLAWLIEDQVASHVDVNAERLGLSTIALNVIVSRFDGTTRVLRFDNVWGALHA